MEANEGGKDEENRSQSMSGCTNFATVVVLGTLDRLDKCGQA
jgi:hypothetical protein